MASTESSQTDLLPSAHAHAMRLCDTLARHEAELSDWQGRRVVRTEEGLAVLRRAIECAKRVATDTRRELTGT